MKRFAWILLLASTSPVYAQNDGDRPSIGEEKPLSDTVKEEEQQPAAFSQPAPKPAAEQQEEPERVGLPDSAPQNDRH